MKQRLNRMIKQLAFSFISLSLVSSIWAQDTSNDFIELTGTSFMEVVPDEIVVAYILEDENGYLDLDQIENDLNSDFSAAGIEIPELTNSNALKSSLFFSERHVERREYRLMVHDANSLKKVYRLLKKAGTKKTAFISLSHSQLDTLEKETRIKAIKVAMEKADYMMATLGQKRGKAIIVKDVNSFSGPSHEIITGGLPAQYDDMYMPSKSIREPKGELDFKKSLLVSPFIFASP